MPTNEEVLAAVQRLRSQGMTEQVIFNRLILCHWPQQMILAAIAEASRAEREASRKSIRRSRTFSFSTVALSVGALVLLGGGAWTYANYPAPVFYSLSVLGSDSASSTPLTYGAWPALGDLDFYAEVTKSFSEQKASFITADLTRKQLTLYRDGEAKITVPILTIGKPGSWWETPVGIYEIQSREENHLSSFTGVYQPWSLAFQGNFFIHGVPYYSDGTEVSSDYSGGCIRLATPDAQKVYELASVGMPVIVYKTAPPGDTFVYQPKGPRLLATSSLAVDIKNGTVLASQNEHAQVPIASIAKLMTALVAVDYLNLEKSVIVPAEAMVGTVIPRLKPGARENIRDLLVLMLTESSNEAAEALASGLGRDIFIERMNDKARAIGLYETTFADPSGLSPENISTARDLFLLLQYIYENRRFIFSITSDQLETPYGKVSFQGVQNFNGVKGVAQQFVGGKIGNTDEAKETYAGVFTMSINGKDREIGIIVLGSSDVQTDVKSLLSFINKIYIEGIR